MICLNCRKQIPDDATGCPFCGKEVFPAEQLSKEIGFRRYQRWFFYLIIILVFAGMTGMIIKIYSENSKNIAAITKNMTDLESARAKINATQKNLDEKNADLAGKTSELEKTLSDLAAKEKEKTQISADLASSTADFKKVLDEKVAVAGNLDKCQLDIGNTNANVYSLIIKLGQGVTNKDISKIQIADTNLANLPDADNDGLSDTVEGALGSSPQKADTDGDGFNDKAELLKGFNYLGAGTLGLDPAFAAKQKGKILLQVQTHGEAWYVSPEDGKRYFLGDPAEAFRVMSSLGFLKK